MKKFPFLFSFLLLFSIVFGNGETEGNINAKMDGRFEGRIGAIVDHSSRIGKEEILAMQMAVEDFNSLSNQSFGLLIRDSKSDPNRAALAAEDLISKQKVQVLLGSQTWEEVSLVAEVGSRNHIPVLTLADVLPRWATEKFPFLVQASPQKFNQMKAIAAIIGSWDWHLVNVICQDRTFSTSRLFSAYLHAFKDVGAEISEFVALPNFDSDLLSNELERLRSGPGRIFVVHLPFEFALHLFARAEEMGMMGKDYVWITADSFTSLVHSCNFSINSLLQGVVGVKSYFPESNSTFIDFSHRFRRRFKAEHPEEDNYEPGIYAVEAYDAARTAALAMNKTQRQGNHLLENIDLIDFQGFSGKIQFKDRQIAPANTFQIINVMKRSYRDLGFWSDGSGFSMNLDLEKVFWPGGSFSAPRGWVEPTDATPLRIGVPTGSMFKQYVNVEEDHLGNNSSFSGLAIDLFKATLEGLPFPLPHELYPFNGTYTELVEQIHLKKFDAAIGDIAIVANRYQYAEFTQPYSEAGLVMVVPVKTNTSNKAILFMKPFTVEMWVLIAVINIYNGFVVWLIERDLCPEPDEGSMLNQAGSLLCSSFTTLFSLHGSRLHSNLSRMTMVVWLFMALVITQVYTANLTSMLTVMKLEPTITNIWELQRTNALVGFASGSFVARYLTEVLHFHKDRVKNYSTAYDYAEALNKNEIGAAFLEVPFAKLFLARYCNNFMISGPVYKVGGFGFAFPKGSPLLHHFNEAMLTVSEAGKYRELENNMLSNEKCEDGEAKDERSSLGPKSFFVLFVLSGGVSTAALTLYIIHTKKSFLQQTSLWRLMLVVMKHWGNHRRQFSRRVSDVPQTTANPNNCPHEMKLQIQL